jgi:RNA-binding protein 25
MKMMIPNITSKSFDRKLIDSLFFSLSLSRGTSLARRLKDREHEIEIDNRDRRHEKDEIEDLRQKLLVQDGVDDIEIELKKRLEKEEELIRKRLADLIRTTSDESADESDNEEERPTNRKDLSTESVNTTKVEIIEQSIQPILSPQIGL